MESSTVVAAFDEAGSDGGALQPIYHFNATRLCLWLPSGATVLDLACGPGRFLGHLLAGRPDLRGIGLDLSENMLAAARKNLNGAGVGERVDLITSDWREADKVVEEKVHAVTCLSALHHCPTRYYLREVLSAVHNLHLRDGCGIWLFDLVRPPSDAIVEAIPRTHEVSTGSTLSMEFKLDWMRSLCAGWTKNELADCLREAGIQAHSREAYYSQLHTVPPKFGISDTVHPWSGPEPDSRDAAAADKLASALGISS